MKKKDIIFLASIILIGAIIAIREEFRNSFTFFTLHYPFIAGFFKFAILATAGECIAMRILHGQYFPPDFGIMAKAFVWGMLGFATTAAFGIYYSGVPVMLASSGFVNAPEIMAGGFCLEKVLIAFAISFCMNTMFAPVLMVTHKIADMNIKNNKGKLRFKRGTFYHYLENLDWKTMWNFVLCRSVVFFWIPAHTCVFLLPAQYRVLTAALLGAVLGLILALAASKQEIKDPPEVLL